MIQILTMTAIWFFLSQNFQMESIILLLIVLPLVLFLYKKLAIKTSGKIGFMNIFYFIINVFFSFFVSFQIFFMSIRNKVYRGIFELELDSVSDIDLFFLSCTITIVPDTLFLSKSHNNPKIYVHKISSSQKTAHQKSKILFRSKTLKE